MNFPLMRNNILREDLDCVINYLKKDNPQLTQGDNVKEFEEDWSSWLGVKYSVFVNSGASANLLSLAILRLKYPNGGEVIVPPLTWVSDVASVLQNGFTPVFADIDLDTLGMNTDLILKKINKKTRAVFFTHAQGFDGLTDKLINALNDFGIPLIEDVCESHGARHNNIRLGNYGWISNFSFYYAHHMSTIEGGMICTNDATVYQQARMMRSHGLVRESNDSKLRSKFERENLNLNPEFIFAFPAYNVRNNEIGGILGKSQLKRLDENIVKRTRNLVYFLNKLDPIKFKTDFKLEGSSNYAFNLVLNQPNDIFASRLIDAMKRSGIEFRRGSAGGGNQIRQPYLTDIVPKNHHLNFPNTEHVHFYGFYIGNYPDMTLLEIDELSRIINEAW
jgi:CDP-6-deoxy-D-xylo-4-hexulose-3-dehydrase